MLLPWNALALYFAFKLSYQNYSVLFFQNFGQINSVWVCALPYPTAITVLWPNLCSIHSFFSKIHYIVPVLVELVNVDMLKLSSHFLFHSLCFNLPESRKELKEFLETMNHFLNLFCKHLLNITMPCLMQETKNNI